MNSYYHFRVEDKIDKNNPVVVKVKEWVDQEYDEGRVTSITDDELDREVKRVTKELNVELPSAIV